MSKQEKFFDVYVSYPPNTDRERIHACLYDNLPENEVESLIQALAERPQAIVAEKCTQDERENAQHYFSYLGFGRDRPSGYGNWKRLKKNPCWQSTLPTLSNAPSA